MRVTKTLAAAIHRGRLRSRVWLLPEHEALLKPEVGRHVRQQEFLPAPARGMGALNCDREVCPDG